MHIFPCDSRCLRTEASVTGLNLAQTSVFATCAMVLATFNISKVVENGQEVSPKAAYGTGAVR